MIIITAIVILINYLDRLDKALNNICMFMFTRIQIVVDV